MSRSVGWPTAAVMRRTWRLRPSRSSSSIHDVGIALRTRIGGSRAQSHSGSGTQLRTGGQGGAVVQHDAVPEALQAGIVRDALDLHEVDLRERRARLADTSLPGTEIGEQQQAFAVVVEPTGGVDAVQRDEVAQAAPVVRTGELRQDLEWLVEEDQAHCGN